MSDQFVAEIRIFAGTFAPVGWATCNGQLLPISQNTALFSLLGTTYGGDGKSTFALPNLAGSAPMHPGAAAGGTDHFLGEPGGSQTVTLLASEMPVHNHSLMASTENGTLKGPLPTEFLGRSKAGTIYQSNTASNLAQMNAQALSLAGSSLPHDNLQPYLALTFIIALQGIFPPRG
ncbi:MAG: phage tail protein [Mesorhizobium sp.]|uniref:phage tail protein n=1 Tax=unclassified Mesorhizobium TaxID=325217 RepID=UPI000F75F26E|nr:MULTISPECIES: tail fiber protein [unclassified Mesorhizobium]AZO57371.1 phage tail protein [Mesorhizobium sp. M8A.F.Ca.ET.057.01.1.1]RWE31984.1 MAG: phage tail protein [Mesorhizobium sp.]RWE42280.1 MAG: phage tail protein [Mesorhizobium sp.]